MNFGPATAHATVAAGNWATYWLEMADVNGDGKPDAVVLTLSYVTYWLPTQRLLLPSRPASTGGTSALSSRIFAPFLLA